MHLKKIHINQEHFCFTKGLTIDLKPVTLLVGDQGCGKSTLLRLLQKKDDKIDVEISEDVRLKGIKTYYFDTESMNPRVNGIDSVTTSQGHSKGIGIGGLLSSKFMSHGEVLREFTVNAIIKAKDCVLFLDEPESGLSLMNQYKLGKAIEQAAKQNVQLIVATHCLPLMLHFKEVYDLENKAWTESSKYIETVQKQAIK